MPWQPALPYNAIIVRYNEIATKGRNRITFEDYLIDALKRALAPCGRLQAEKAHGRIFLWPFDEHLFSPADLDVMRNAVPTVAGVSSISPGFLIQPDLADIERAVQDSFPAVYDAFIQATPALPRTYAMRVNRANKHFPLEAAQIEKLFAEKLLPHYPDLKLDLNHAALRVEVEIRRQQAFVCYERIQGPGGLPVGSGGRVLALLSGGIDSPVACFQMMRRGCAVDYITFHSDPYTPPAYITKVTAIARKLNDYQRFGRFVAVNLLPAQKAIRDNCKSRYRTILYRRFMLRIADHVAHVFRDHALVTGDNIGQVASQTLNNMAVINAATSMLVLRPLLTFEKLETVAIAEKIGTIDLSNEQVPDSCTVFAPDDPATSTFLPAILKDEQNLDIDELMRLCLEQTVVMNTNTLESIPLADWTPRPNDETCRPDCPSDSTF